jgi:hypothetical protein
VNQADDEVDTVITDEREYHRLRIEGADSSAEIWVGDDHGHPVVRGVGTLDVHLMRGFYTVQFSLPGETYPIALDAPIRSTEAAVRASRNGPRPTFRFYDHPDAPDSARL